MLGPGGISTGPTAFFKYFCPGIKHSRCGHSEANFRHPGRGGVTNDEELYLFSLHLYRYLVFDVSVFFPGRDRSSNLGAVQSNGKLDGKKGQQ